MADIKQIGTAVISTALGAGLGAATRGGRGAGVGGALGSIVGAATAGRGSAQGQSNLQGRYDLEVIDIYQHPEYAGPEQIVVAPTLIKKLPLPLRKIIGDLSDKDRVLIGLDIVARDLKPAPEADRNA